MDGGMTVAVCALRHTRRLVEDGVREGKAPREDLAWACLCLIGIVVADEAGGAHRVQREGSRERCGVAERLPAPGPCHGLLPSFLRPAVVPFCPCRCVAQASHAHRLLSPPPPLSLQLVWPFRLITLTNAKERMRRRTEMAWTYDRYYLWGYSRCMYRFSGRGKVWAAEKTDGFVMRFKEVHGI